MEELQVVLLKLEVDLSRVHGGVNRGRCGPEDIVVVGKKSEKDAEEEAGR